MEAWSPLYDLPVPSYLTELFCLPVNNSMTFWIPLWEKIQWYNVIFISDTSVFLLQEHELLSEQLEKTQKKLLRVAKDRSFLLDRMLRYEKVADSSSDSDATDHSDSDTEKPVKYVRL